jgi:hypothetical protein
MPSFTLAESSPQVEVAGHGLDPGVGDGDQRLRQVGVREADGFVHGASRSLVAPVGDIATAMFEVDSHGMMETV